MLPGSHCQSQHLTGMFKELLESEHGLPWKIEICENPAMRGPSNPYSEDLKKSSPGFFMISFFVQKLLSLIRSHLFNFGFISITVGGVLNLTFCLYIESCPHCPHCLMLMTLCLLLSPFFRWRLAFCSLLRVTPVITVMLPSSLLDGSAKVNCLPSPRSIDWGPTVCPCNAVIG